MTVLVLRALGIGDLATAVPALRGIRSAFPDRRITLAAPAWLAPLAVLTGAVDHVIPVSGLTDPPRLPHPRLAVNLHGRGPQSHRLLKRLEPQRLLAFRCPDADFHSGPVWLQHEPEVHRWCRLLRWYGIGADPSDLTLRPPEPPAMITGATVIHPGAKAAARRWPAERFAAVARELTQDGQRVVLTGAPRDRALADLVARLAGLRPEQVLAGDTDVGELAALVAAARLVISGDTGVAHLAFAYGTPSVSLFGPVTPALWGPPPHRHQHVALWEPGHAQGCGEQSRPEEPHPALLAITPPQVLVAARAVLSTQGSEALVDM